jgi:TetR/AcrR family transcriptional regulator, transcriptional repressor for nem operon
MSAIRSSITTSPTRARSHARPGELRHDTDVARLALGTLAALQGGLLLTQAKRDVGPLEAALDLAICQISYYLG